MGYILLAYSIGMLLGILAYYEIYKKFFIKYNKEESLNEWASRTAKKLQESEEENEQ